MGADVYYARVLRALAGGEWVAPDELTHPASTDNGVDAAACLLQAVGYVIEADATAGVREVHPSRPAGSGRRPTARLLQEVDGHGAWEEGVIIGHYTNDGTALVMFPDGTAATLRADQFIRWDTER